MRTLNKEHEEREGLEIATRCARLGIEAKAEDVDILDLRGRASFTDFFVIMSGRSTRHVQGMAENIEAAFRSKRLSGKNCEGLNDGHWVLLDFSDVIVHIFYHETRAFYDLEGLWHDAPRIALEDA